MGTFLLRTNSADGSMQTCLDAFLAAYANIGVDDLGMFVEGQVYLSKHLFWTSLDAFPAGFAFMRVELYVRRLLP